MDFLGGVRMADDIEGLKDFDAYEARIMVIGCGGGGCNTITRLTDMGIKGASTVAINTDARHLSVSRAHRKLLIGEDLTRGLGAGGYPDIGRKAAEESKEDIRDVLSGCDLLFISCGLGGGTGTGSIPVISKIAKEMGAIVIAPVTVPFRMEGSRIRKAEEGLMRLRESADTAIIIENQRLVEIAGNKPIKEAFGIADELIATMIKGVTELISQPSLVNLDYADVRAIMHSGGVATIGVGSSNTNNRAREATDKALRNPLLNVDYEGATGALIQIIGGEDMTLEEINSVGTVISEKMSPEATVMWGARIVPGFGNNMQVITIITGVNSPYILCNRREEEKIVARKVYNQFAEMGIKVLA
ncbi:MAG: cell division protein FtsZ [Candidatus Aenigmarchaeota archaeon]|nr:cell division protein FtsZ [Candidatus Aenigmarchaeota archaeon]